MTDESSSSSELALALIDSHCVVRDGLRSLFDSVEGFSVVAALNSPAELPARLNRFRVDVIITELLFSDADALRCIADWAQAFPETKVLVLSQFPESVYAERALSAGAAGYLMKDTSTEHLIEAVRQVREGRLALSPAMSHHLLANFSRWRNENSGDLDRLSDRELMVMTLIGQGQPSARIAHAMGISKKTVSTYKERIKDKLSLENSLQLTQIALQHFGRSA